MLLNRLITKHQNTPAICANPHATTRTLWVLGIMFTVDKLEHKLQLELFQQDTLVWDNLPRYCGITYYKSTSSGMPSGLYSP